MTQAGLSGNTANLAGPVCRWVRHLVGTNYLSDVGLAALDVDRDGWPDLVCSGVWYRNRGKPREQALERIVFDENAAGAHDILIADIDGDSKPDVVMMGDERTKLNLNKGKMSPEKSKTILGRSLSYNILARFW